MDPVVARLPGGPLDLALLNASVFDGREALAGRRNVGIRQGRIVSVGEDALDAPIRIDLAGRRLIPGLIDAHVHLFDFRHGVDPEAMSLFVGDGLPARLRDFLRHGVTTVKSVGDPTDESLSARARIESGELIGPRLFVTGKAITAPDGHPAATVYRLNGWYRALATGEVASCAEARDVVRQLADAGVDAVKLLSQGACACSSEPYLWRSKISGAVVPIMRLKPRVLHAAIEEAKSAGLRTTVHTYDEGPAIEALEAGADGLEHGVVSARVSGPRLIDLLLQTGAGYVPTLWIYNYEVNRANLAEIAGAGARIVLGTDTFVGYGAFGANTIVEAERMASVGMARRDVLRAATSAAALHLGQNDLGMVAAGCHADLVVYERDPLEDIAALCKPGLVVASGRIVHHSTI